MYTEDAVRLTEGLLMENSARIRALTIVPSSGGVFEVKIDGRLVFSRLETDRFPKLAEIVSALDQATAAT